MPFKFHAERHHHIPKQRHRVSNGPEHNAALKQRGSLTMWFSEEAILAWQAAPRTTPGGQPSSCDLAITTALTLRAVFHLPLRQSEGLIGSILALLGLDLSVPDHSTLSRRAATLQVPIRRRLGSGPLHLRVDSSRLKLDGAGEGLVELVEKHGTSRRRAWRKRHIGIDAESGEIVAVDVTAKEVEDGSRTGALLDRLVDPVASVTGDAADDQDNVYPTVTDRHPDAAVIVSSRATAVPSSTAKTDPARV